MRRWLLIILLVLFVLLAATVAVVQIVLQTDLPRQLVLKTLEQQTGLQIDATSLRTTWLGESELRGLSIALPLESTPFLTIPALHISHADLVRLAILGDAKISCAEIEQPHVHLMQADDGSWNVLEAIQIAQQRQETLRDEPGGDMPPLPELLLSSAELVVEDNTGRSARYGAIDLSGKPDDSAWRFSFMLGDSVTAEGRLAPRAGWSHELVFSLHDAEGLLQPWVDDLPAPLHAEGHWHGRIVGDELVGMLVLDHLQLADDVLAGSLNVRAAGSHLNVQPMDMTLSANDGEFAANLERGDIAFDTASLHVAASNLLLHTFDTQIQLDGGYDLNSGDGELNAAWAGSINENGTTHAGTLAATLTSRRVGWQSVSADIQLYGRTPDAGWDAQWRVDGWANGWRSVRATISSPRFMVYTEDEAVDYSGFSTRLAANWPQITLTQLNLPGAASSGRGTFHGETNHWTLDLTAERWNVPGLAMQPLDVRVQAAGNLEQFNVDVLRIVDDAPNGFMFDAGGVYSRAEMQPLYLRALVSHTVDDNDLAAQVDGDVAITGVLHPLSLFVDGEVAVTDIGWSDRRLEDLHLTLRGRLDPAGATFSSSQIDLFDGQWKIDGRYVRDTHAADAVLSGSDVSIEQIVQFADTPVSLAGRAGAELTLRLPDMDPSRLNASGQWTLDDLNGHGLTQAHGRGDVNFADNHVQLQNIHLEQEDGRFTGNAAFDLQEAHRIDLNAQLHHWRVAMEQRELSTWLSGTTDMRLDLDAMTAEGQFDVAAAMNLRTRHLADAHLTGSMNRRTVLIDRLQASAFQGTARGNGRLVLSRDRWTESEFEFAWENVDLAEIPGLERGAYELTGGASGLLRLTQSDNRRAPEPVELYVDWEFEDAAYGPLTLSDAWMTAYLGTDRFMIDSSRIHGIGGTIDIWGRITAHEGEPFTHVGLTLEDIDLEQIAQFTQISEDPLPGRISGSGYAGGYFTEPHRLFGQADLQLTQSDIASLPGFAQLYDIFNINFGQPKPTGRGEALVQLEGDALNIARLTYFNRGMDVVTRLRFDNIWAGAQTPMNGLAVGTVRPLRDTRLPLIGDNLDRLLSAIQADAASVRIGGTVAEHEINPVPLAEITGALQRIIRGEAD